MIIMRKFLVAVLVALIVYVSGQLARNTTPDSHHHGAEHSGEPSCNTTQDCHHHGAEHSGEPACNTTQDCHQHGTEHCGHQTHVVCHIDHCECTDGGLAGKPCKVEADCLVEHSTCTNHHHFHCIKEICHCVSGHE